jgi:hypothetical protein
MRKSWRWWVPVCIGVMSACGSDKNDSKKGHGSVVVETSGCPGEQAILFVDDQPSYNGEVTELESASIPISKGHHSVQLWIDGEKLYDMEVDVASGQKLTIEAKRSPQCPDAGSAGDGDGNGDGDGPDGSVGDAGTDGGIPVPVEACSSDDNTMDTAQLLTEGAHEDKLCGAGDVDFFKFSVGDKTLTKIRLSIKGLTSTLSGEVRLYDAAGKELDKQVDGGDDAVVNFSLLGSAHYFLRVADVSGAEDPDGGVLTNPYKLALAFAADTATVEASAGTFHGANNSEDTDTKYELSGAYVASSVHTAGNKPVDYKLLGSVKLPGADAQSFVYDPSDLADGVLRIVYYNGTEPVNTLKFVPHAGLNGLRFNNWLAHPVLFGKQGVHLLDAFDGDVVITFPSKSFTRTVVASALLPLPTVTAAVASGDPTTIAVTMTVPTGAKKFAASAFGSGDSAAHGTATPTGASFNIVLDKKLDADEAFTVRVQAADTALIKLPLPETSNNVSEFIYYSDKSSKQE